MSDKKTLVIGASENPSRYSNMAIRKLRNYGHTVVAIGRREGTVLDVPITKQKEAFENIDTVTMYVGAQNQAEFIAYILNLNPKRIIFNPGAENDELAENAEAQGIKTLEACTLVLLSTGQY